MPRPEVIVDGPRLWASIMEMASVGATTAGGSERLALTDADADGRHLLLRWAHALGMSDRVDHAGNLFLRREGAAGVPSVLVGSHLDTQPDGGRFDGVFGVLAALEAVRALNSASVVTERPITVVVWANEEGGRFADFCTGSGAFSRKLEIGDVRAMASFDGSAYGDELDRLGWSGDVVDPAEFAVYLEAHIEQGPLLEQAGLRAGIVHGIRGIRHVHVAVTGRTAHAGSPMAGRADALAGAAELIVAVNHRLDALPADPSGIAITAGRITAQPNAQSVVPGRVELTFDVRGAGLEPPEPGVELLLDCVERVVAETGLSLTTRSSLAYGPIAFDAGSVELLRSAAGERGVPTLEMVSAAGHDAGYVASVLPTAMLFIPCRGGVSHHPDEFASEADVTTGAQILLDAVREAAART